LSLAPEHAWLVERPIAHRGLHNLGAGRPENSLAAFAYACELEVPIELDARLTADEEVVVIHDASLDRLVGVDQPVHGLPASEVTALSLLGTGERIPRLSDVLELVDGRVPVLIDLKPHELGATLERLVARALTTYDGDVAVEAFSPLSLLKLRMQRTSRPYGQVSGRLRSAPAIVRPLARSMATNSLIRPDFMTFELAALPSPAASFWRRRGLPLIAWTAETPEQAERALALADNYLFAGFVPGSLS
jgi:glycerophosphoryl diester phosphodiesterase